MRLAQTILLTVVLLITVANLALMIYVFGVASDLAAWAEQVDRGVQIEQLEREYSGIYPD